MEGHVQPGKEKKAKKKMKKREMHSNNSAIIRAHKKIRNAQREKKENEKK